MLYVKDRLVDLWHTPEAKERETQLLRGERVKILEDKGEWLHVEALDQPQFTDSWHGYRGWMRGNLGDHCEPEPLPHPIDWLGKPYLWGGLGLEAIDCSGLVHLACRRAGYTVPRDASCQMRACDPDGNDLIFMAKKDDPKKIVHVMIRIGGDLYLEATSFVNGTRLVQLDQRLIEPDDHWVTYKGSFSLKTLTEIADQC